MYEVYQLSLSLQKGKLRLGRRENIPEGLSLALLGRASAPVCACLWYQLVIGRVELFKEDLGGESTTRSPNLVSLVTQNKQFWKLQGTTEKSLFA